MARNSTRQRWKTALGCLLVPLTVACSASPPSAEPAAPPEASAAPAPAAPSSPAPPAAAPSQPDAATSPKQAAAPSEDRCRVAAYVADPDPKGLNVRGGPGSSHPVVGVLPTAGELPTDVVVVEARGGWLRIGEASGEAGAEGLPQSGWVFGKLLGLGIRNYGPTPRYPLHERPDAASPVVVPDPGEGEVKLLGCEGGWVRVLHPEGSGWLAPDGQCPSAVTNCS